jgi:hypothetical protein
LCVFEIYFYRVIHYVICTYLLIILQVKKTVNAKIPTLLFVAMTPLIMLTGCYTQFATFEQQGVAPKADTIKAAEKETCIWERDLMGFPYLHCYPSYYPRQWYLYTYSPWWYHNDRHLYNADRCPPYYYYDPNCGCCRYYLNNPELSRLSHGDTTHPMPSTRAGGVDSNRVTVSTSSHSTVYVPLYGSPKPQTTPVVTPVTGQSTPASSAIQTDSLHGRDSVSANAQAASSDTGKQIRTADTVPLPVKRPQRSMRGR